MPPPLQKQIINLPLTGGMDTKQNADVQDASTLRQVTDLRFNGRGEYVKRPGKDDDIVLGAPNGSTYSAGTPTNVFGRGSEVCVLTQNHGIGSVYDGASTVRYASRDIISSSAPDAALKYAPAAVSVSRSLLHSAQYSRGSGGLTQVASAVYNSQTLVVAWSEMYNTASRIYLRAYDLATGVLKASTEYINGHGTLAGVNQIQACEYTETGKEGVLIAVATSVTSPVTINAYRYSASGNSFAFDSALTTNAQATLAGLTCRFALKKSGNQVLFGFQDNTSGNMVCQLRTVSTVASTHTATHPCDRGLAFVVGTNNTLIISNDNNGGTELVRAEIFGTPGTLTTIFTAAAGEALYGAFATLESGDVAVVATNSRTNIGGTLTKPEYSVRWAYVSFASAPVTNTVNGRIPNVLQIAEGFTHGSRVYAPFGLFHDTDATTTNSTTASSVIVARFAYHSSGICRWDAQARVLHDRFYAADPTFATNTQAATVVGSSVYMTLLADPSADEESANGGVLPQSIMLSKLALGQFAPSLELDRTAMVGSGILWEYDGNSAAEASCHVVPAIELVKRAAGALTGVFGVAVVYPWVDAAGRLHRSAPAIDEITLAGEHLDVYVRTIPFAGYVDDTNSFGLEPEVYITAAGGSVYYLANDSGGAKIYRTSVDTYGNWFLFQGLLAGSSANPQVYSDGSSTAELVSEPPPAFCSIARIGDRVWGVDAEDRSRIWFSKPLVAGYAVEWNTACTLVIGDEGVAIEEAGGVPTVFGRRGIWQIYGDGPNALGVGSFAPARRLPTDVTCTSSTGIARTPAGVVFRGRRGVYLLSGKGEVQPLGLPIDPELRTPVESSAGQCRITYDEFHNEVRVLDSAQGHFVYNMLEQKWTEWSQSTSKLNYIDQCIAGGRLWALRSDVSSYYLCREYGVDESGHDSTQYEWTITTPWLSFDGVSGYVRLWRVFFSFRIGSGPAPIKITTTVRGPDETQSLHTWDLSDISALGSEGNVVDLVLQPRIQKAKAFKFTITQADLDLNGNATTNVPLGMRFEVGIDPGGNRRGKIAALKGAGSVPS